MKINFNMSAIIANSALGDTDNKLTNALERLSSGIKINHAKDNPAGLAIAKRMNAQIQGLSKATQNASDGISIIESAEGALAEIQDMLQRMNELAVQGSTGTMDDSQRSYIQKEVAQLKEEITRISKTTQFNGKGLLDGNFDLRGYTDKAEVSFDYYSDEVPVGKYAINVDTLATFDADGKVLTNAAVTLNSTAPNAFPPGTTYTAEGNTVYIKGKDGFEMTVNLKDVPATLGAATLEATGVGAMRLQVGPNEGQILELRIPSITLENMKIDSFNLNTAANAKAGIGQVAFANNHISQIRSRLGAYQNRLEHTTSSLDVTSENMTSAYSRVMDMDMATEMTEYTKLQVMSQAGTAMLAQANERPQQVLQLLQ